LVKSGFEEQLVGLDRPKLPHMWAPRIVSGKISRRQLAQFHSGSHDRSGVPKEVVTDGSSETEGGRATTPGGSRREARRLEAEERKLEIEERSHWKMAEEEMKH
jgi:hypothetical protein